jgi:hypothetical protein
MPRTLFGAIALASLLVATSQSARAQQLLPSKGFGSLSGKVTLEGDIPVNDDFVPAIKAKGADLACCLAPKAITTDQRWIVDKKTKAVANVVVWVKTPKGTYFEIHPKLKDRSSEKVIIDQPNCAFLPYVSAYNPSFYDGKKMVATGQELIFKNSSVVSHNVRASGNTDYNFGFNRTIPVKDELNATKDLKPQEKLKAQPLPVILECNIHPWMAASLYVFDHPYYAITKADGSYEIANVPAGAEVILMVHHVGKGWVLPELSAGRPITLKAGETKTMDFTFTAK